MKFYFIAFFLSIGFYATHAQGFVYRPTNPSFGGDTFNYNWLLSSAQVQDKNKDPATLKSSSTKETSQLADFASSLSSQLLSTITRQLYTNQFGEEGLKEGTYQYGDLTVDISPGNTGLIVRITDGKGGETAITVPYY